MVDFAETVFRDFETDGVAASGAHKPRKAKIREWGAYLESFVDAITAAGGYVFPDKATIDIVASPPLHAMGWVVADATPANNGIYRKMSGAEATWARIADLPYSFIKASDAGAGTANAVVATTSIPLPSSSYGALITMNVFEENTGSVTWSINGETPKPVVTNTGNALQAGYLAAGMAVMAVFDGVNYRLMSDVASASIVAAAEAAAAEAEAAAASVVIKDYDTNAAVEAATVPALANFVRTAGHTAVGDDGDGLYARVEDVPARAKYITDQGSQHFAITSRTIRDATWGLFPNTTNPHLVFKQMIDYLMLDKGGGELQLTDSDQYDTFLNSISMSAVSSGTLTIWNKNGGVLKAATGLAAPLMNLRPNNPGGAAAPQAAIFKAYDLNIDNSLGSYSGGASSATGLSLVNWDDYVLTNYRCIGGYDPNVDGTPTVGGDSGLSDTGCRHGTLINPYIAGQPDAGYYPNWDNSGDEGGYREVIGGTFYRNKAAVTAKRNLSGIKFIGTKFIENDAGVTTNWVDNGGWVEPCKKLEVIGCTFIRGRANLIAAKRNTKLIALGNTFEDIGYNPDGTNSAGANARCIRISGTTGATARGNTFRMRELAVDLQYAFSFVPDADTGTSYTGGGHNIGDNIFENWYRHSIGGTNDIPSNIGLERITSTMEANLNASDVNAASRYEYVTDTDPHVRKIRVGTTNYRQVGAGAFPSTTVTLTALGSLAAGATTAVQTLSVPGLTTADNAYINRLSATLVANPGIAISWRTAADTVQYYFRNNTASAYDFTGQSIRISF